MSLRRLPLSLLAIALFAAAALTFASIRAASDPDLRRGSAAADCPPGYASRDERMKLDARERAGERLRPFRGESPGEEALGDSVGAGGPQQDIAEGPACVNRRTPEPVGELMAIQENDRKRSTGGVAETIKPGAYRAAVGQRQAIAAAGRTLPGTGGDWRPAGKGPLIADDPRFGEVNGLGLADLAGRISDFARAPDGRIFAAVGEGGVWQSDDQGGSWRSIGDSLPTQAVGGIGFSTANGGTVIAATGDSVFGGGGTFAGLGVFRTTDGGQTWQKSAGVPDNVIAFRVAVDPTNPDVVYAATGAGLFRSADAGASFENVALPTGDLAGPGEPNCTGAPSTKEGCFLANMVTDVEVQTPGGTTNAAGGKVIAAVGWRSGDKLNRSASFPGGFQESPSNGLYASDTGAPGSFARLTPAGFTPQTDVGRVEFGSATGPEQNHEILYAIVENSSRFNGDAPGIDADGGFDGTLPPQAITVLDGMYSSTDFGQTWTLLADGNELQSPTSGTALAVTFQAVAQYGPGVQSWYNQWIEPDPTRQTASGVPTRLLFGLEEVWQNDSGAVPTAGPGAGSTTFKVVGRYFGGNTCLALNNPAQGAPCPNDREPRTDPKTTHPDHQAALFVPQPGGGVRLLVGHDGGVNVQDRTADQADFSNNAWGRGANDGFQTLLPYDAQIAKDNTIYAGLQDNGELRIEPDGRQFMTYGGDGAFSAVDPDDSKITYEGLPGGTINKSTNGGESYSDVTPPGGDSYLFINPYTMDPLSAKHLITAGNRVSETDDAAASWTDVFTIGDAPSGAPFAMSAIDTRSIPSGGAPGGGNAKASPNVPEYTDGGATVPGAGVASPATTATRTFTIKPDETNASATILVRWADATDDWDLRVTRRDGDQDVPVGASASGGTTSEQVVLASPPPGEYTIAVDNFAARPGTTFTGSVAFAAAQGDQVGKAAASYVAFCGFCDALNDETRPFDNGIATNVTPDGKVGEKGSEANWHRAAAKGLPKRYITSVQVDPVDPRTVYATVGGYSRRWLPADNRLGEGADVSRGSVFRSTDAGETFTNISANLPDAPANWTVVRGGRLVVATNAGVYQSANTSGGDFELLGAGLPNAPVFTLEMKPKASPAEVDTLIAATQGRGVYRYEFKDPVKPAGTGERAPGQAAGQLPAQAGGRPTATACASGAGFKSVSAAASGRTAVRLSFARRVSSPVQVDVFRVSQGRRVVRERLVARFTNRTRSVRWNGVANRGAKRKAGTGYYFVRYTMLRGGRRFDVRRVVLRRSGGRFARRPDFFRRATCDLLSSYKLERPVFGGPKVASLKASYRLTSAARVTVTVTRGSKVVRRYRATTRAGRRTYRITLPARRLAKGDYRVRLQAGSGGGRINTVLTSRRL